MKRIQILLSSVLMGTFTFASVTQAMTTKEMLSIVHQSSPLEKGTGYFNHAQKGPVALMQTWNMGTGGPGGGRMQALFVLNTKNKKAYDVRENQSSQPAVAYGDERFVNLKVDSTTQVSYTHKIENQCFDYKAVWHGGNKVYQPKLLKSRKCRAGR